MNFKGGIELNHFLFQLNNLYSSAGTYGMYDMVYDKLIEDKHDIKFEKDIKDQLWAEARKKFNKENKRLVDEFKNNSWPEDKLKALLHKYFKSKLVAKYLLDKVPTEGCLIITDESTGKQRKMLNIVGYGPINKSAK